MGWIYVDMAIFELLEQFRHSTFFIFCDSLSRNIRMNDGFAFVSLVADGYQHRFAPATDKRFESNFLI